MVVDLDAQEGGTHDRGLAPVGRKAALSGFGQLEQRSPALAALVQLAQPGIVGADLLHELSA